MRWLLVVLVACSSEPRATPTPQPVPTPTPTRIGPSTAAVTQLAVGQSHTCALHADAAVSCWGLNTSNQLGIEKLERSLVPIAVPGAAGAVEISAEDNTTCIRRADNTMHCWGYLGQQSDVAKPAQIADGVAQLSGRCFRSTEGTVSCLTDRAQIVAIDGIDSAVKLASYSGRGCVARKDGTLRCWFDDKVYSEPLVKDVTDVTVNRLSGCALLRSGVLQCYTLTNTGMVNRRVLTERARSIVAGGDMLCARGDGTIACWDIYDSPAKLPSFPASAPVAMGPHSCFARSGRDVACWGGGLEGELGNGWWRRQPQPTRVPGLENIIELGTAFRGSATCARSAEGIVWCWGQLPNGPHATPFKLPLDDRVAKLVSAESLRFIDEAGRLQESSYTASMMDYETKERDVAMASDHCFITKTGRARCWRSYMTPDPDNPKFALMPKIEDAVEIRSQSEHGQACVRHRDGHVSCFQPGSDKKSDVGITDATRLAFSDLAQCAIRADHSLWCWGSTQSAIFSPRPIPADVPLTKVPVGDVAAVSLARDNICAVRTTGTVACWGSNDSGQLGDGTYLPRSRPADVMGITDAIDVQLGTGFACVLHRGGHVSCWGATERGQIGTFATDEVKEPVSVVWP